MKVLAFAGSNSKTSINKTLVTYAISQLEGVEKEILDLNDYPLPMFGVDLESQLDDSPENAKRFLAKIKSADALIISHAEHNRNFTAVYKNLLDWMSRIDGEFFKDLPIVIFSTSPGARGASSALMQAEITVTYFGGKLLGQLSVPKFNDVFDAYAGDFKDQEWADRVKQQVQKITAA